VCMCVCCLFFFHSSFSLSEWHSILLFFSFLHLFSIKESRGCICSHLSCLLNTVLITFLFSLALVIKVRVHLPMATSDIVSSHSLLQANHSDSTEFFLTVLISHHSIVLYYYLITYYFYYFLLITLISSPLHVASYTFSLTHFFSSVTSLVVWAGLIFFSLPVCRRHMR
jgi:hypothetical protein